MVGVPGFLARFLALDRRGRGGGVRIFGIRPDRGGPGFLAPKYSFAASTRMKNTVLQFLPVQKNTVLQLYQDHVLKIPCIKNPIYIYIYIYIYIKNLTVSRAQTKVTVRLRQGPRLGVPAAALAAARTVGGRGRSWSQCPRECSQVAGLRAP